ncbi:hypothetical protein ACQ4PT_025013 [Festuca glaucescens]
MAASSSLTSAARCGLLLTAALVLVLSHGAHAQGGSRAGLSSSFYDNSCPGTRDIVRRIIQDARIADARIPASLIRLHFHYCFVNSCNGSLLLDDDLQAGIMTEKKVPANDRSARGFDVDDDIKRALEKACPGIVSCADILTLAAEISVELARGPYWSVPLGRRDGTTTNIESANNLSSPFDPLEMLQEKFKNLGLDDTDLVALQGAHTFGRAQCQFTLWNCTAGQLTAAPKAAAASSPSETLLERVLAVLMAASSTLPSAASCGLLLAAALVLLLSHGAQAQGGLSPSFYDNSCPGTRDIVRRVIQDARVADARIPASLIRLHFHDCFVNGCDGSLLLDDDLQAGIMSEKKVPANDRSARGFDVVDDIKRALEKACPGTVSCADILTLAAEISVELAGGPYWSVPLGRRDGTTTNIESANNLPSPFDPLETLQEKFKNLGLDDTDLVALQGAHTFGRAQCQFTMRNCTAGQVVGALVNLDGVTPDVFDNKYYGNLLQGRVELPSDQVMLSDPVAATTTAPIIRRFSGSQKDFFSNFAASMIKMGSIGPLTGRDGEIRKNCRRLNKKQY